MRHSLRSLVAPCLLAALASSLCAAVLQVGPGKKFDRPSRAIAAASAGDTIEIAPGTYKNDWAVLRTSNLTLRGVGGKAVLQSQGMIPNRKAIWVVAANDIRVENVEFRGARVGDRNGAGIRQEGRNLTLRECGFFDNENGILGGGGDCVIDVQHCEFARNSLVARPGTHNLYIGHCRKLIFMYNYSHHAKVCHLLKSRAQENVIMYNRICDEETGSSSYVINLPNAGRALIVGNILHQGPRCQNRYIVAYGEEGPKGDKHELQFIHNTVINDCTRGSNVFVSVRRLPGGFRPVLRNNIFVGKGQVTNWPSASTVNEGNFVGSVAAAKFVDRAKWDLHLQADSPCVDKGVPAGRASDGTDLTPTQEYVHPMKGAKRPTAGTPDIGAYERAK